MSLKVTDFSYTLKKQHQKTVTNVIIFILVYYIIMNLVLAFLVFPVRQVSDSMLPELPQNSFIMTSPVSKTPERGQIVLLKNQAKIKQNIFKKGITQFVSFFTAQQINLNSSSELPCSNDQLRRVVGLPGDTIYMKDYVLYVCPSNERHFLTEFELSSVKYTVSFYVPPAEWDSDIGVKGSFDKITLGQNEYFVLGDNRKNCSDSRLWGPVPLEAIKSKAFLCYFPFNNFKLFK